MTINHTDSSGNIFADLGFPDAETRLVKAKLVITLERAMRERSITSAEMAVLLAFEPAAFDAIFDGHVDAISTDDLLRALTTLDRDIQIVVGPKAEERAHGRVTVVGAPVA